MLKVEPRFELDRSFKGPFVVQSLTATNAVAQLQRDNTAEKINISRQRLSLCSPEIGKSTPWVGHTGKLRKRRQLCKRKQRPSEHIAQQEIESKEKVTRTTRSGRKINKPSRFLLVNSPEDYSSKRGEVVRHVMKIRQRACDQEKRPRSSEKCSV